MFAELISEGILIRTVISLDERDKRWLDRKAAEEGVSMTEVIRRAVRHMRAAEKNRQTFEKLLGATKSIGTGEDGLVIQKRLRDEWKRRRPA
jgi:Arc/MetJ-type ribon-helix-helix transcriptional regulator